MNNEQLDLIRERLARATSGPWEFDGVEINTVPSPDGETPWKSIMDCQVDCMSYCYGGSVAMDVGSGDRELIANAPTDIAYLLNIIDQVSAAMDELDTARTEGKVYTYGHIQRTIREALAGAP